MCPEWLLMYVTVASLLYRCPSISRLAISRIFDKSELFSGSVTFLEILEPLSRIPTFDKSDIFRRKSELKKARKFLKRNTNPGKSRKPV